MPHSKTNPEQQLARVRLGTSKRTTRGHAKSLNRRIKEMRHMTRSQRAGQT